MMVYFQTRLGKIFKNFLRRNNLTLSYGFFLAVVAVFGRFVKIKNQLDWRKFKTLEKTNEKVTVHEKTLLRLILTRIYGRNIKCVLIMVLSRKSARTVQSSIF